MAENIVYTASITSATPPNQSVGNVVYDATTIVAADSSTFDVGFKPRYVKLENVTDRVSIEWYEGMAANTCIKTVAAGTRTLETTNGGITVGERDFSVLQNATLGAVKASKVVAFLAIG